MTTKKPLDFGAYAKQGPNKKVVKFTTELKNPDNNEPVIFHVKHTGKGNQQFAIDSLRQLKRNVKKQKTMKKVITSGDEPDVEDFTTEEIENLLKMQKDSRKTYARCVVVGWENVSIDGQDIEFSEEACAELLDAMDDDYFDTLVQFCQNKDNFDVEDDDPSVVKDVVGN